MDPETKQAIIKLSNSISTLEEQMKNESKDQIELQLHEQYAVNNNANVNSIITFIVGIVAVLGSYGYVYVDVEHYRGCHYYYTDLLFVATCGVFVLWIISLICINVGANQRYQQFMIHAIRCQAYKDKQSDATDPSSQTTSCSSSNIDVTNIPNNYVAFSHDYHPFNKTKDDFIQGIFNTFNNVCHYTAWLMTIFFVIKYVSHLPAEYDCELVCWFIIYTLLFFSFLIKSSCHKKNKYKRYQKMEKEYEVFKPDSNYLNSESLQKKAYFILKDDRGKNTVKAKVITKDVSI